MARDGQDEVDPYAGLGQIVTEESDPYASLGQVVTDEASPGRTDALSFGKGSVQLARPVTTSQARGIQDAVRSRQEEDRQDAEFQSNNPRLMQLWQNLIGKPFSVIGLTDPERMTSTTTLGRSRDLILDSLLLGGYPQVQGAMVGGLHAGARALGALPDDTRTTYTDVYDRVRDYTRANLDIERGERGFWGTLPYDVAGGTPYIFAGPVGAAARGALGIRAATEAARTAPGFLRGAAGAAGWGAGFGGAHGFNVETGSWEDKFRSAAESSLGGALLGTGLYSGVRAGVGLGRGIYNLPGRLAGRRPEAAARVEDWRALGEEPPGVLALSPGRQRLASWLSRNLLGWETRRDIARGTGALQTNLEQALNFGGGRRTASEAGVEAQELARRAFTARRSPEEIAAMSPETLQDISGVGPGGYWRPEPRVEVPLTPPQVPRVTGSQVLERYKLRGGDVARGPASITEVPESLIIRERSLLGRQRALAASHDRMVDERIALSKDLQDKGFTQPSADFSGRWVLSPRGATDAAARLAYERGLRLDGQLHRLKQSHAKLTNEHGALVAQWDALRARRIEAQQGRIQREGDVAARAETAGERLTGRRQARAQAAQIDAIRQERAARAREIQERRSRPVRVPVSRESFPTQAAAGEEQLRRAAPSAPGPLLTPSGTERATRSALVTALENIGLRARSELRAPGYKQAFDNATNQIDPRLVEYIGRELGPAGPRVVELLRRLAAQGRPVAGGEFAQGAAGTDRIVAELARWQGNKRVNQPLLRELITAIETDLDRVVGATPGGLAWQQARQTFRAEIDRIRTQLEEPLAQVTGNPNPAAALRMLQEATRSGGNIRTLEAFLGLAEAKGDRNVAVSLLLQGLSEGGVHSFARNYRALTPEAKSLLFQGPLQVLGHRLERLAGAAGTLSRFEGRTGNLRFRDYARIGNVSIYTAIMHPTMWPGLITLGVGAKLADKVLASAAFRRWMTALPVEKGVGSREWATHMARLSATPGAQLGVTNAVGEAVKKIILGSIAVGAVGVSFAALSDPAEATVIGAKGAAELARVGRGLAQRILEYAKRMFERGMSLEDIRLRVNPVIKRQDPTLGTVVQFSDGQFGLEVSNVRSRYSAEGWRRGQPTLLGEVFRDPELATAYLGLRNIPVVRTGRAASYHAPGEPSTIGVGHTGEPRRSIVHEVEHEVAFREDFPRGAGVAEFREGGGLEHLRLPGETPWHAYRRVEGEWFARQAAERADLSGAERRLQPLNPPENLIPLRYGNRLETVSEARGANVSLIQKLLTEGRSKEEIAREVGISPARVTNIIRERRLQEVLEPANRLAARSDELTNLVNSGMPQAEIARTMNLSPGIVSRWLRRLELEPPDRLRPVVRLEDARDRIVREVESGMPFTRIALGLHVSPSRLYNYMVREGLAVPLRRGVGPNLRGNEAAMAAIDDLVRRQTTDVAGARRTHIMNIIAARFGVSRNTVRNIAVARGMPNITAARRGEARRERSLQRGAETHLDRAALDLESAMRKFEDDLRRAGASDAQIAARINAEQGTQITAEDLRTRNVWWRLGEISDTEFGGAGIEFDPKTMGGRYED